MYYSSKLFTQEQDVKQGLIADWPMNEGSGTTIFDKAGTNNGTIYGVPNWSSGKINIGSTNYIDCGNNVVLTTQGARTLSFWMKSTALAGNKGIFAFNGIASVDGFSFIGNQPILLLNGNTYKYWSGSNAFFNGMWHHFMIVLPSVSSIDFLNNSVMYDNSIVVTPTATKAFTVVDNWTSLIIGKTSYGSALCFISEARIYNRALTPTEVTQLYNFQKPQYL